MSPAEKKVHTRFILQVSIIVTVALAIHIFMWAHVIHVLNEQSHPEEIAAMEAFGTVTADIAQPKKFNQQVRDSPSCSDNDLVCMQVATLQPSEVLKGVNGLIPSDTTKHYLVKISVSPIEDFER
jgi:hypothetical protein